MKELNRKRARIRILSPNSTHFRCHVSFFRFPMTNPEPGQKPGPARHGEKSPSGCLVNLLLGSRGRQQRRSLLLAAFSPTLRRVLAAASPPPRRLLVICSPPPRRLLAASFPPPFRLLVVRLLAVRLLAVRLLAVRLLAIRLHSLSRPPCRSPASSLPVSSPPARLLTAHPPASLPARLLAICLHLLTPC